MYLFTGLQHLVSRVKTILDDLYQLENVCHTLFIVLDVFFRLDKWLAAAVDCLEYFPDEQIVMLSQQLPQRSEDNLDLYKKMLFDVVAKYYSQERDPFIEGQMVTILPGVVELMGENYWLRL